MAIPPRAPQTPEALEAVHRAEIERWWHQGGRHQRRMKSAFVPKNQKVCAASAFLEAIADAIEGIDHIEFLVDGLKFLA
jgi:hypothetical protein